MLLVALARSAIALVVLLRLCAGCLPCRWFRGGLYDTKYLSRSLPEVFGNETSLGEVYKALAKGGWWRGVRGDSCAASQQPPLVAAVAVCAGTQPCWALGALLLSNGVHIDADLA